MPIGERAIRDIVVASLTVNRYPITDVWELIPSLREHSLFDPKRMLERDNAEIIDALEAAGYRRGKINWIVAPRLHALMSEIEAGSLDELPGAVAAGDEAAATAALTAISGIGPTVAATAWMLLTSKPEE